MTAERSSSEEPASISRSPLGKASIFSLLACLVFSAIGFQPSTANAVSTPQVAIAVPLSLQTGATGFITAQELSVATAPGGYLTRMLDAVANQPVTLAIDPMILVSIRVLGSESPPSATEWLERLASINNETFALSYADSDVTLALQAGSSVVVAPSGFDFALRPGRFSDAVTGVTQTPVPEAGIPLPTTEDLLFWDYSIDDIAWPIEGSVTAADLEKISASGFTTTLVSSSNSTRLSQDSAHARAGSNELIVADFALSTVFREAVGASSLAAWQSSSASLASAIVSASSGAPANYVLTLDRGTVNNPQRLQATIFSLASSPAFSMTTLSGVTSGEPRSADIVDMPHSANMISITSPLLSNEIADADFAQVAADPALITDERRVRLLASLAPHWNRYPGGWGIATGEFLAESVALRASVRVVASSEITFAADRGMLPITVQNGLNQSATVFISVRPRTPLLSIENSSFELQIEPDSQRKALIPAEALSNGTVELVVSIRNSAGGTIGQPVSVTTRVQAGWEGPVTLVLGIALVIVFTLGLLRTIRRRRITAIADDQARDEQQGPDAAPVRPSE